MALSIKASFAAGELDPALHERTNLQKYSSALATARNVVVGKTGRLLSRPGRKHFIKTKTDGKRVVIHPQPHLGTFLEWGDTYVRVHYLNGDTYDEYAHAWTEASLDYIRFVEVDFYTTAILAAGKVVLFLSSPYATAGFVTNVFDGTKPATPTQVAVTTTTTGVHNMEYQATVVVNGVESNPLTLTTLGKNFIGAGEYTSIEVKVGLVASPLDWEEIRIYRRPQYGSVFGYVGSSNYFYTVGADKRGYFYDVGSAADYTHQPPTQIVDDSVRGYTGPAALQPFTGCTYQKRFLMSIYDKIFASRPEDVGNFYTDYPVSYDSAISTAIANGYGISTIFHFLETTEGLLAFTRDGIYSHSGLFSPDNLSFKKRSDVVIDKNVKPVLTPGGVLVIDSSTNTVRRLVWSDEVQGYKAEEVSIFSDHLFTDKQITSMAWQHGAVPVLWCTFSDGTFASFTFEPDHEMRAWTRHDSELFIEQVIGFSQSFDVSTDDELDNPPVFLCKNTTSGKRYIELGIPRYVKAGDLIDDPEADKKECIAAMDSVVSWHHLLLDDLVDDTMTLTPTTPNVWTGTLTLAVTNDAIFPSPGAGAVGTILRWFHPDDGNAIDLEVTARASNNSITVQPSEEFPSAYATNPRLYVTATSVSGLDHLNGESVSVICDGYIISSPNNDDQNYATSTPSGGSLTIPGGSRWAIIHVGRPYTMDVETLEIDTVEQRPVFMESKNVNKVYVKLHKSSGVYVGNRFPTTDTVAGSEVTGTNMTSIDSILVDYEESPEIIGNAYDKPKTTRYEVSVPGHWKANGKICLRQVDPLHFEVLSIIPDLEDLRR